MIPEFYSFDEVLKELQVEREELQKLVEDGEIKAYREGDKIKFLQEEINDFKSSRMDLPTIAVAPDKEDIKVLDIEEIEDIEDVEEAEFEEGTDDLAEPEETGSPESAQPLLDISTQNQEDSRDINLDIDDGQGEELVFEQESGEDLLETGELLFESKDQILPRDKEIEELFDSEAGVSPFDSREEVKDIDEAWEFAEDGEEDLIAASKTPGRLAIEESRKRTKIKTIGSIIAGCLAFTVIAVFTLLPPTETVSYIMLTRDQLAKVESKTFVVPHLEKGVIEIETENLDVVAPCAGFIAVEIPTGIEVKQGQVVAKITPPPERAKELQSRLQQYRTYHQEFLSKKAELGELAAAYDEAYQKYQKNNTDGKRRKAYEKAANACYDAGKDLKPDPLTPELEKLDQEKDQWNKKRKTAQAASEKSPKDEAKKKLYLEAHENYYKSRKAFADGVIDFLSQLPAQIRQIETELTGTTIVTAQDGVGTWLQENQVVAEGQKIGSIQTTVGMKVQYKSLPTEEVSRQGWVKGSSIKNLKCAGQDIEGTVLNRIDYVMFNPPATSLEIAIDKSWNLKAGDEVVLSYPRKDSRLGVPKSAIKREGNEAFVMVIKDNTKLQRRTVEIIAENESDYIAVKGLAEGEEIVAGEIENLQDGQSIKFKTDD